MVGHLFQNYDTTYVRFFPTYTCNHSCYTIYVRFFCHVYLRSFLLCGVFIPKYMTIFLQTRIYVRTEKPIYMRLYYVLYILLCVFEKSLSLFRFIQVSKSCKMNIMYLRKFEFSHFAGWEGQAQANSSSLVEELRWSYFNLIWLWFNNRASPS